MIRHWTAPAVVGVVVAVVTAWVVRAAAFLLVDGPGQALTGSATWLLYAAGPAVLCAVPLVVLARAVLGRFGPGPGVYAGLGLVGGALVGVVQTGVLLSAWPWQAGSAAWDLIGLPALAGLVGGLAAGAVRARRGTAAPRERR
ncbi:hypothetical protein J1G42_16285 [Cellulomonas sp. zg-ZUI222]|uniref:hypothetical protein n=1 Tax=Cellulomonas TaxID=1707 RepID=UPI001A951F65|nr:MULTISPECIES: hypothetical protein [Cellulomonas]MBO0901500.1 hypothetical protein [Cellulomonas sp. zg-ZUI22]MBO0922381.1 hypothetical protein [Cellulomonas wangleii]